MATLQDSYYEPLFLTGYFVSSLAVTVTNKIVLTELPFPWLLTTLHVLVTTVMCVIKMRTNPTLLDLASPPKRSDDFKVTLYGIFCSINIWLSNYSLTLVDVPIHQIVRAVCPLITVVIYYKYFDHDFPSATYYSMIPLIMGVGLATAGDYSCTLEGLAITLNGAVLASIKTVVANRLMNGRLQLSAFTLLTAIGPQMTLTSATNAIVWGEVQSAYSYAKEGSLSAYLTAMIVVNVAAAVALNLVSMEANKAAGAVTMTVCANVKQVLTIAFGIIVFDVQLGWLNVAGIVLVIGGAAWYSRVELERNGSEVRGSLA